MTGTRRRVALRAEEIVLVPIRDGDPRPLDVDAATRRVDRIVAVYLLVAVAWIVGTGSVAPYLAERTQVSLSSIELAKGMTFVVVTGLLLRGALRRWARRLARAAAREVDAVQAQRAAHAQLREAQELRTRFLRGISHELRTPLSNVVGYAATIRAHRERLPDTLIDHYAERLVVNAGRLEQLVLDLIDVERSTEPSRTTSEPVVLSELVDEIVTSVQTPRHDLVIHAASATVRLDRAKTARILQELLDNAVRHTPDGTCIWIRATVGADGVELTVEDDGPGIPPELGVDVLSAFTQGPGVDREASPGMGIGLALVQRYAQAQHGDVELRTRDGGGASFRVRLPVAAIAHRPAMRGDHTG